MARWLATEGVHAIRALDVDQPVVVDGRVVTFWESANDREEYGTPVELAALLRQLHALASPASLDLPPIEPFAKARWRLEQVRGLSDVDRTFMRERCEDLAATFAGLAYVLPASVVHGDGAPRRCGPVILVNQRDQGGQQGATTPEAVMRLRRVVRDTAVRSLCEGGEHSPTSVKILT